MDTIRVGLDHAPSPETARLICASCGAQTSSVPCADCGRNPLLRGRYRLLRVSGGDPAGMAYEAIDIRHTDRPVEIRLIPLPSDQATDAAAELQARVEQLRVPLSDRIRPVHGAFLVGRGRRQAIAIVQPPSEGVRLEAELGSRPMSLDETTEVLDEVLALLQLLHSQRPPVPAGGLSADRLQRRADGALLLPYTGGLDSHADEPHAPLRAPELRHGAWSPASDIYDVALLAVRLLTGRAPESMADPRGMLAWEHQTAAPTQLIGLLRRWLSPVQEERPVDAEAARAELAALASPPPDSEAPSLGRSLQSRDRAQLARARSQDAVRARLAVAPPAAAPAAYRATSSPRPGTPADPRRLAPTRRQATTDLSDDPTQQRTRLITSVLVLVLLAAAVLATWATIEGLQELF
jgi:hypothetical protein